MRLDLPTFDLPMNAYSGLVSAGHCDTLELLTTKADFLISMSFDIFLSAKLRKISEKTVTLHHESANTERRRLVGACFFAPLYQTNY
jgi:hypothetical protein